MGTNRRSLIGLTVDFLSFKVTTMADERIGFVPTGSSGPFTFGSTTTSFASLNDLSRSLGSFEDDNSKFPRSQISATPAVATDHAFHSNRTSTASASPQQYKKPLAWYDQVHPIPYPGSSSTVFKQEPLDDEWKYDEAEEESEDDNDKDEDDDDDGEDEEDAPVKSIEADERETKRRKRNKPTLSCRECVGKKMRVSLYSFALLFLAICHLSYDPCKELDPLRVFIVCHHETKS